MLFCVLAYLAVVPLVDDRLTIAFDRNPDLLSVTCNTNMLLLSTRLTFQI